MKIYVAAVKFHNIYDIEASDDLFIIGVFSDYKKAKTAAAPFDDAKFIDDCLEDAWRSVAFVKEYDIDSSSSVLYEKEYQWDDSEKDDESPIPLGLRLSDTEHSLVWDFKFYKKEEL